MKYTNSHTLTKNLSDYCRHLVNILAQRSNSGRAEDLPYRSSCLTHVLRESFGGNAKLSIMCAISPDNRYWTIQTFLIQEKCVIWSWGRMFIMKKTDACNFGFNKILHIWILINDMFHFVSSIFHLFLLPQFIPFSCNRIIYFFP